MDARPLLELIGAARGGSGLVLVGIGGRGAAGKTTLARLIPDAQTVSTDEFWDGRGFDIPRLAREVVTPLSEGRPARFSSYDWAAQELRGTRAIEPAGVVVVEGVCALHRTLRDAYAVRVWVEAPADVRLERGVARDGEGSRSRWVDVWMPSEDRYVERDDPIACAHLVVHNGGPVTP
jgi:uridine kinase